MATWFQLTVDLPADLSDRVSEWLFDMGSCGLQVEDGPEPWHGRLIAYFPSTLDRDRIEKALSSLLAEAAPGPDTVNVVGDDVPDEDWATAWRTHFEPVYPTPRMAVCPPWKPEPAPPGGIALLIEPKTAFGTGRHPTTRMALQALEAVVRPGDRVLDVGTGSGILSIAARKLGASAARALDIDPLSMPNVLENLQLNGVDGVTVDTRTVEDTDRGYDVVVANIISSVLIPMLPRLRNACRRTGWVILGGLLDREEARMMEALAASGLRAVQVNRESEWIGLRARKVKS